MKIQIIIIVLILSLQAATAWAGYTGPSTIIQGNWGTGDVNFGFEAGDTMDSFPGLLFVDEAGKIIIGDGVNFRIKIYDSTGNWQKNISYKSITPTGGWPMNLKARSNQGIFSIYEKLQKYDYNGNLIWSVTLTGFEDFWIIEDGSVWVQEYGKKKYNLYSPSGQLIKTSMERPLELGVVSEQSLGGGKYKVTVKYPDKEWSIVGAGLLPKYTRDTSGNLYGYGDVQAIRYTNCGKELAVLTMPGKNVQEISRGPAVEPKVKVLEEYGSPVVAPNGDVYTWKRTPDKYSILKWTWVDDSNVPSGPDAPTGLSVMPSTTGLYLTWTASPQDPGCVTGYEIARATTSGGMFSTVGTVDKGVVKYNDTTASAGTMYYYKVRAVAGSEYSNYTSEVSGKR